MNPCVFFRLIIGIFFIFSGGEKLLAPYENFLYVVQSYDLLPDGLEAITAQGMPWLELFLGVFLVLGLWTRLALAGIRLLLTGFILIVGQAIFRKLPLTECGCFGESLSLPLPMVAALDTGLWILTALLSWKIDRTSSLSLDQYFQNKAESGK